MLRNPIHYYRKEIKYYECSLFKANLLPRGNLTTHKINEVAAWRHLLKNNVFEDVPESIKSQKIIDPRIFDDIYADFRPEHPVVEGYRISVVKNFEGMNNVLLSVIKRTFRDSAEKIFTEFSADGDVIFYPKNCVYFADSQQISSEILAFMCKNNLSNETISDLQTSYSKDPMENYFQVLCKAYADSQVSLFNNFRLVASGFDDKSSIIFLLSLSNGMKKVGSKKQAIVELRKWCRANGISGNFYKYMSNIHSAILGYEEKLGSLSSVIKNYLKFRI